MPSIVASSARLTITAVQDVFGLPATSLIPVEPPGYVPPSLLPAPFTLRRPFEAPYRELVQALGSAEAQAMDPAAVHMMVAAVASTSLSLGYEVATRIAPATYTVTTLDGPFCPSGVLAVGITPGATQITVLSATRLADVRVGTAALIDDEIVRVDAVNPQTGVCTIGRGCADTVPRPHAAGTRVWFYDDFAAIPQVEYSQGVTVDAKLLTRTSSGLLAESAAPADSLAMVGRAGLPYPPGNLKINGQAWPEQITGELAVSWSSRDRITQADQLLDATAGNTGPATGITYRLRIYTGTTLRRTYAGITSTSQLYSVADEAADGGPFTSLRVVLDSQLNGKISLQAQEWTVTR